MSREKLGINKFSLKGGISGVFPVIEDVRTKGIMALIQAYFYRIKGLFIPFCYCKFILLKNGFINTYLCNIEQKKS